jgi:PHS family inorganic phosphate transporter-like MFS transporter
MIVSAAGLLPGYYVAMLFIDSWGRKRIQIMGFVMLTLILSILGSWSIASYYVGPIK